MSLFSSIRALTLSLRPVLYATLLNGRRLVAGRRPEVRGHRRMAVLLARGLDVADARRKTGVMMEQLEIKL